MIKNNVRDYAVSAFEFYSVMGRPDDDAFKERVYRYACSKYENDPFLSDTQKAINKQNLFESMQPAIADICAVNEFLKKITHRPGGAFIKKAVETVYMTNSKTGFLPGDFSRLVHKAEFALPASEATVYRYLSAAREAFASVRGLRTQGTVPEDFM